MLAVQVKLNELLDADGGISRRKVSSSSYCTFFTFISKKFASYKKGLELMFSVVPLFLFLRVHFIGTFVCTFCPHSMTPTRVDT